MWAGSSLQAGSHEAAWHILATVLQLPSCAIHCCCSMQQAVRVSATLAVDDAFKPLSSPAS